MIWFENLSLMQQAGLLFLALFFPLLIIHGVFSASGRARTWTTGTQASLLSAVAIGFSLMASVIFNEVTSLYDKAKTNVMIEAASLDAVLDLTLLLPENVRKPLVQAIHGHLDRVLRTQWPRMRDRAAEPNDSDDYTLNAMQALADVDARNGLQAESARRAISHLDDAHQAEVNRLIIAQTRVHPLKWLALFFLAVVVQFALAMHHAQASQSRFLAMLVFTLTVLAYFLTIVAFNHPFGGDVTVSAEPLRSVWGKAATIR